MKILESALKDLSCEKKKLQNFVDKYKRNCEGFASCIEKLKESISIKDNELKSLKLIHKNNTVSLCKLCVSTTAVQNMQPGNQLYNNACHRCFIYRFLSITSRIYLCGMRFFKAYHMYCNASRHHLSNSNACHLPLCKDCNF